MGQYDDIKCTLAMRFLYDAAKHWCDYHSAKNRTGIRLKTRHNSIYASIFATDHTIEEVNVESMAACDIEWMIAKSMVAEVPDHAAASVVELFQQTPVILQTIPFYDPELVSWLYDPLSP